MQEKKIVLQPTNYNSSNTCTTFNTVIFISHAFLFAHFALNWQYTCSRPFFFCWPMPLPHCPSMPQKLFIGMRKRKDMYGNTLPHYLDMLPTCYAKKKKHPAVCPPLTRKSTKQNRSHGVTHMAHLSGCSVNTGPHPPPLHPHIDTLTHSTTGVVFQCIVTTRR